MKISQQLGETWKRSTTRRFCLWLVRWRTVRAFLFVAICLVTLVALFYAIENWRGKRAWEAYKARFVQGGGKVRVAELVPPPIPAEQNFAQTPFIREVFENRGPLTNSSLYAWMHRVRSSMPTSSQGDPFGQPIDLIAWANASRENRAGDNASELTRAQAAGVILGELRNYQELTDQIRAVTDRPYARYPVAWETENPWAILLPHLSALKAVGQLLQVKAVAELAAGRTNAAFATTMDIFRVSDSLNDEPILISHLVRLALFNIALQPLWEGLNDHRWTGSQLEGFETHLRDLQFLAEMKDALQFERAASNDFFELLRRNRIYLRVELDGWSDEPASVWATPISVLSRAPSGWLHLEQLNYNRLFDQFIVPHPADDRIDPRDVKARASGLDTALHPGGWKALFSHRVLSRLLLPAMTSIEARSAKAQNAAHLALVSCALERYRLSHGEFPPSPSTLKPLFLDEVPNDIITGSPLKYQRTPGGGYLLYSVGWDAEDDDGMLEDRKKNDGDWVLRIGGN